MERPVPTLTPPRMLAVAVGRLYGAAQERAPALVLESR
jgi:hypothetical protein